MDQKHLILLLTKVSSKHIFFWSYNSKTILKLVNISAAYSNHNCPHNVTDIQYIQTREIAIFFSLRKKQLEGPVFCLP